MHSLVSYSPILWGVDGALPFAVGNGGAALVAAAIFGEHAESVSPSAAWRLDGLTYSDFAASK